MGRGWAEAAETLDALGRDDTLVGAAARAKQHQRQLLDPRSKSCPTHPLLPICNKGEDRIACVSSRSRCRRPSAGVPGTMAAAKRALPCLASILCIALLARSAEAANLFSASKADLYGFNETLPRNPSNGKLRCVNSPTRARSAQWESDFQARLQQLGARWRGCRLRC